MAAKKKNISSSKPATKGDLEDLREDLQADIVNATDSVKKELRADMKQLKKEIITEITYHFDATVENIRHDLVGANRDEISALKSKVKQHDAGIVAIKEKVGM